LGGKAKDCALPNPAAEPCNPAVRAAEIFLSSVKPGSAIEAIARDELVERIRYEGLALGHLHA